MHRVGEQMIQDFINHLSMVVATLNKGLSELLFSSQECHQDAQTYLTYLVERAFTDGGGSGGRQVPST